MPIREVPLPALDASRRRHRPALDRPTARRVEEGRVVRAAEQRSVRLYPMSDYRTITAPANTGAVVMGYACLTEREIGQAVAQPAATGVVG